jgi:PadR family transcriptional regulator, regulatory protein PadR
MASVPRMTIPVQLVLSELLVDPRRELYGLEISKAAGLASGTVHPILARLEAIGWVESRWEEVDPRAASRPARRYYRLTGAGAQAARPALARASRATRRVWTAPAPGQA